MKLVLRRHRRGSPVEIFRSLISQASVRSSMQQLFGIFGGTRRVNNRNLFKLTAGSRINIFRNNEIGFAETSAGKSCRNLPVTNFSGGCPL